MVLSSRIEAGQKGKGSDKGGDGKEGKEWERERERCTATGMRSGCLTRLALPTPSTAPFPLSALSTPFTVQQTHDDAPAQTANLSFFLEGRPEPERWRTQACSGSSGRPRSWDLRPPRLSFFRANISLIPGSNAKKNIMSAMPTLGRATLRRRLHHVCLL